MSSAISSASRLTSLQVAPGVVLRGQWKVLEISRIDELEISFDPKKTKDHLDLTVPPVVIPVRRQSNGDGGTRGSGRFRCIRRPSVLSIFIGNSSFASTMCFVVDIDGCNEMYIQGMRKYFYYIESTRYHYPNPHRGVECLHGPGGCIRPKCCLRAILSDRSIHEHIAYFLTHKCELLTDDKLVQAFAGRISKSMIAGVKRELKSESRCDEFRDQEPLEELQTSLGDLGDGPSRSQHLNGADAQDPEPEPPTNEQPSEPDSEEE